MKVSYYPGCSLDGTASEYGDSFKKVAGFLGIELEEIPDWTCCGASSAHVTDDRLAFSLAARNLMIADKLGKDLVVPCAACYRRLKQAEKELIDGIQVEEIPGKYSNNIHIKHSADFIWEACGEKTIKTKVKEPLIGLNPVCYYGCLTVRPPKVTGAENPEDPQAMDDIMR
ncbi:MAG: heterodisulfide reductase-related iron-sulfur binding cluster, partial [Dehalococcoidales bacterium]